MFPENLQLSRKIFQKAKKYRENFINYRGSYLATSWQKYATIQWPMGIVQQLNFYHRHWSQ